ncbi:hypothetical protein KKB40_06435 [Patescibacteria group bacterium]|nr:hypothetical protein [Patescibacteria group bacterium]
MNKKTTLRKLIASGLAALLILLQSPIVYSGNRLLVYAQTVPTAPIAPTPPPEPENEEVAPTPPEEPVAPSEPTPPLPAPTAPPAPAIDEVLNPTPTPTLVEKETSEVPDTSVTAETTSDSQENDDEILGQTADGQVGDTEINSGDATSTATIVNDVNSNLAIVSSDDDSGGITVLNIGNGEDSTNFGSVSVVENTNTTQDNGTVVVNNLNQDTNTGTNSASKNVGNSSINSGDANTTGTIINTVNTNVDGVMVVEFNIADDHLGDIILNFEPVTTGESGDEILVENSQNGTDSTNTSAVDTVSNNDTFQINDALVENNMTLASNSGDNTTDKNTAGDSEIETSDANVAANILNFANNNIAGNVIYTVVNIFGDLVGDIIFHEATFLASNSTDSNITAVNSGNGADSENTALVDQTINDETIQFNTATIENNLVFDANTGENSTSNNTNGDSSIETGDVNIEAQVVNVVNTNVDGENVWLVIINEAGNWIGKIFGSPDGSTLAGSEELEFLVGENGEITVVNSDNGASSVNSADVSQEVNDTLVQTNTADIVNNVNLSANTGGNSASNNVGGDSSIKTGDANIVANIVNFVNNNITGSGRMFVTVINVFGSWIGDFISPGYEGETDPLADDNSNDGEQDDNSSETIADSGIGGSSGGGSGGGSSDGGSSSSSSSDSGSDSSESFPSVLASTSLYQMSSTKLSNGAGGGQVDLEALSDEIAGAVAENETNFNLAWLLFLIPIYLMARVANRNKLLSKIQLNVGK